MRFGDTMAGFATHPEAYEVAAPQPIREPTFMRSVYAGSIPVENDIES
jgi:hypothetical protein